MNFSSLVNPRSLPLVITSMLFALLYGFGALSYDAFFSPQVFINARPGQWIEDITPLKVLGKEK